MHLNAQVLCSPRPTPGAWVADDHSWRHSAGVAGLHAARTAAWPSPGTAGEIPQSVPCSVFAGENEALDKGLANIWDCIQSVR